MADVWLRQKRPCYFTPLEIASGLREEVKTLDVTREAPTETSFRMTPEEMVLDHLNHELHGRIYSLSLSREAAMEL